MLFFKLIHVNQLFAFGNTSFFNPRLLYANDSLVVSAVDFKLCDPSSNPGRSIFFFFFLSFIRSIAFLLYFLKYFI